MLPRSGQQARLPSRQPPAATTRATAAPAPAGPGALAGSGAWNALLSAAADVLAVLGPAGGFGALGEGAGRILELNVSVGQGLAIAAARSAAELQIRWQGRECCDASPAARSSRGASNPG